MFTVPRWPAALPRRRYLDRQSWPLAIVAVASTTDEVQTWQSVAAVGVPLGDQLAALVHSPDVLLNRDCALASTPPSSARVSTAIIIRMRICVFIAFPPFLKKYSVFSVQYSED
jgi:hypothetical protein